MIKTPFMTNLGVALMNAGVLIFLLIGLFTNNLAFAFLFLGGLLLGLALMFLIRARREGTDTSVESIPAMIYLALVASVILLFGVADVSWGYSQTASLGLNIWWTLGLFITSIGSFYQAVRTRGSERRSNLGTGISALAWVVFYVVYNFSLNGTLKTITEVVLSAIMLLGVLLIASADRAKSGTLTGQLDRPKAKPFYAEQLKQDSVKEQR